MSITISKEKLCEVTNGLSLVNGPRLVARGLEYDSREIKGGELFVALRGEHTHGHEFLKAAFDRGAALFLVEDEKLGETFPDPERLVCVADSLKAFWRLASWWRRELKTPILGITGSVGKTTTKEMAAAILAGHSPGIYSLKSHNNHVGVPYTLCRIGEQHRWAVVEMGMSHPGEITILSTMATPDVAVITTVAPAHIGAFDSLEGIAREKFAITDGLSADGVLVLNGDNELTRYGPERYCNYRGKRIYFGTGKNCEAQLLEVKGLGLEGIEVRARIEGTEISVKMNIPGVHNGMNALAAAVAARFLVKDLTLDQVAKGLAAFTAPLMRLNVHTLIGERQLIDDAYNASPESMAASLALLGDLKVQGKRVGLILGDMKELGEQGTNYHQELAERALKLQPSFCCFVGEYAASMAEVVKAGGGQAVVAASPEEGGQLALKAEFDILLVKASRGVGLDRAVKVILAAASAPLAPPKA